MKINFYAGNNGGVIHGIQSLDFKGKCSAYFDKDFKLIDATQTLPDARRTVRPVKINGPIWNFLEKKVLTLKV